MTEGVVDVLEVVEIHAQQRERAFAALMQQHFLESLPVADPVGQACQRVAMRGSLHLRLVAAAFGDVLVRGHPAAVGHGLLVDGEAAPVLEDGDGVGGLAGVGKCPAPREVFIRCHVREAAEPMTVFDDLAQG
jgi:hypothetical protein